MHGTSGTAAVFIADREVSNAMNLLQWLNKLGILRWGGTAAVYRNTQDRPIELQEPGVFNAERDLFGRGGATAVKPADDVPSKTSKP